MKYIPLDTTLEEVRKVFAKAGKIVSIKLNDGEWKIDGKIVKSYQYAYILYEKYEDAQLAIKKFHISDVFGPRPIDVSLWESKEQLEENRKSQDDRSAKQVLS